MSLSTQPYKGARDFYPEDKRVQKYMFGVMRDVAERFGYEEYDAPILEPTELFASKTSDEIVNEQTYTFEDRGGRSVTIRTEMTPTVSRMVAGRRQELAYPVRWYSIPNFWRYERPQRGRLREFWQLNIDLFGIEGLEAEFEAIQVADAVMQAYGAKRDMYVIKLNSRPLIGWLMSDYLKLNPTQTESLIRLIDRMNKLDQSEFKARLDIILSPTQRDDGTEQKLLDLLKVQKLTDMPEAALASQAVKDLQVLMQRLEEAKVTNIVFDITLMRGFDYYTGTVFEIFDTNPENNRSMFGGGRYDGLVGLFGVEPVPAVGFAMGDATLQNFLEANKLLPKLRPETDVYVIMIGDIYAQAQTLLKDLRGMEVNVAVDISGRKLDKQIKSAAKKGIRYVLFVGNDELTNGQYKLKDLIDGKEEAYSLERLVSIVKDRRTN